MKGNVIVGQSGGPTAAINSSLAGVYRTAIDRGAKKVYGMLHGIEGLLKENYIDLSEHIRNDLDVELLKRTPAAYLGSCRYKLPDIHKDMEIYKKIFEILDKLEIEALVYIGGNDSMDTIKKLSDYAILTGSNEKQVLQDTYFPAETQNKQQTKSFDITDIFNQLPTPYTNMGNYFLQPFRRSNHRLENSPDSELLDSASPILTVLPHSTRI